MRDDTTAVLERDGGNLKALARRAVAFEALEKFERALEDARKAAAEDSDFPKKSPIVT